MDITDINLDEYDLVKIDNINVIKSNKMEKLYDITVDGNHTFFISLPNTDNDLILAHNCDGNHIASIFLGWFAKFAPNLFNEGKICRLYTPLILVTDKKDILLNYFFSVDEYKKWESTQTNMQKYNIIYTKGLGSWSKNLMNQIISKSGLESMIQCYKLDDDGKVYLDDWLNDEKSDKRKEYLKSYQLDINNI